MKKFIKKHIAGFGMGVCISALLYMLHNVFTMPAAAALWYKVIMVILAIVVAICNGVLIACVYQYDELTDY